MNMHLLKVIITILCLLLNYTSSAQEHYTELHLAQTPVFLGQGFNIRNRQIHSACVQGKSAVTGRLISRLFLQPPLNSAQLTTAIGFQPKTRISPDRTLSSHTLWRWLRMPIDPASESLYFYAEVGGTSTVLETANLSRIGQRLTELGPAANSRSTCGDAYVVRAELGGRFLIRLHFSFGDPTTKGRFFQETQVDQSSLFTIADHIQRAIDSDATVAIHLLQMGGSPTKLLTRLAESFPLGCSKTTAARCREILSTLTDYLTQPDGFRGTLADAVATGRWSELATLHFETKPYTEGSLAPLRSPITPPLSHPNQQAILQAFAHWEGTLHEGGPAEAQAARVLASCLQHEACAR